MNQLWVYILMVFFFVYAMGHLVGLSSKTLQNLPSSSKNHIFYIVIYVHCFTQSCKIIYIYIHTHIVLWDHIKLYKYIYFYTYTECKSQMIYMHNIGTDTGQSSYQSSQDLGLRFVVCFIYSFAQLHFYFSLASFCVFVVHTNKVPLQPMWHQAQISSTTLSRKWWMSQ